MLIDTSLFFTATHVISCPNFRITYELMIKLHGQMGSQEILSRGSPEVVACLWKAVVILIAILFLFMPPTLCPDQILVLHFNV